MGKEDTEGDEGAQHRGQTGAEDPQIQSKDKEIIPKDIEDAAGQNGSCGQSRGTVVAEEGGQHLVEQKQWNAKLDRQQIPLCQRKQGILSAEKAKQRGVKEDHHPPAQRPQNYGRQKGGSEGLGLAFPSRLTAPPGRGEEHRAADPGEESQTVNEIPDGCHHRQSGGALRALVLSHHGHVHHGVDGADEGAAKGRSQIPPIQPPHILPQKIHTFSSPFSEKKSRIRKQASQPVLLSGSSFPANDSPSE